MIIEDLKADLSEAAQEKLKAYIGDIVEKKLQKEIKKITKKLTVKFVLTGVTLASACIVAKNAGKIIETVKCFKD